MRRAVYFTDNSGNGSLVVFSRHGGFLLDPTNGRWERSVLGIDCATGTEAAYHQITEAEAADLAARVGAALQHR
jgi:hypothetical protein